MPDLGMATLDDVITEFGSRDDTLIAIRMSRNEDGTVETQIRVTPDLAGQSEKIAMVLVRVASKLAPSVIQIAE